MSLEGTIRDLGLLEVGQLLSLSRKSGTLRVESVLRGARAWMRFVDGALVDAGSGDAAPAGVATDSAAAGVRADVEHAALEVLAWRDGHFLFVAEAPGAGSASQVRIPTDAMLVESARRDDAWNRLRERVASPDAIPSFVDVEPKSLPLLRLEPPEWEVLTRVDGQRSIRTLARLMRRDVLEIAEVVYGLVGGGLLVVADPSARRTSVNPDAPPIARESSEAHAPMADLRAARAEPEELWIPATAEMAVFDADGDADDVVFDPLRAGLLTPHGSPRVSDSLAAPSRSAPTGSAATVTSPANGVVASEGVETSLVEGQSSASSVSSAQANEWRDQGDQAAREGDFELALSYWSQYLRTAYAAADADRVREAVGLTARLQALLHPMP